MKPDFQGVHKSLHAGLDLETVDKTQLEMHRSSIKAKVSTVRAYVI